MIVDRWHNIINIILNIHTITVITTTVTTAKTSFQDIPLGLGTGENFHLPSQQQSQGEESGSSISGKQNKRKYRVGEGEVGVREEWMLTPGESKGADGS